MRLPTADPRAAYAAHRGEIEEAIGRVLEGGRYILGEEVAAFERELAAFLSAREAIGVGSGTEALHLALRACGVGPGDIVVTVSHTAVATVAAIELAGARAVLVDVDEATFTMDPERLGRTLEALAARGGRAKAVVPVHLYGLPCDLPRILELARRHGALVVEDCAQSHGAAIDGRATGAWGDAAAFSFYPTKNLGALGDAGAVVTSDAGVAARARRLREYGWRRRYVSEEPGWNTRLDELQAAILRVKLRHLADENAKRVRIAAVYAERLARAPLALPSVPAGRSHVYHQYVVKSEARDDLARFLEEREIGTQVLYPVPVHLQPAYAARVEAGEGRLAASERLCARILSLPMHPFLADDDVAKVTDAVAAWSASRHG